MFRTFGIVALALTLTGCGVWDHAGTSSAASPSVSSAAASASALPMRERTALEGKLTYRAPDELIPMSLPRIIEHYPSPNQPAVVLDNASGSVMFTIDHTRAHTQNTMEIVRSSMSGVFRANYPAATWYRDELADVNGRIFAVFEEEHGPAHAREHVITYVTKLHDTLLLVMFSVRTPDIDRWLSTARSLMNSIVLHE